MELDVRMDNDSLSIPIDNPFHMDTDSIVEKIGHFAASNGTRLDGLDIKGLLPKMVRGIVGCEGGCPSNALEFVSSGFGKFELAYVEGGILTARAVTENGKVLNIKMFPDF
ncbi:MAG TPA: hypothetical protein DHV16_01920 [Nitrospiraceae bacterium]|nr:MAG: hypothetical protein A2Z82_10785 [Nitrospirae bacterium GWA2_46_11]OGW22772.1 MAG: hypothetical protein A2X55_02500 [Nitrospirae bacterium GWB2_47_37]HAK89784.1 hypothetical protein [Nitrospiraceae bacterium]HCL81205.1 hypothetical protein [Nitrospiraceae bacterium]HCZ11019.1 hypothetical protein [Nitrospiraceae bacterium]